ncbi:MAG: arginyltransferase [Methylococcus sp.]|nr:MAG: arginyltransferase [Methylococcus sp.]
MSTISLYLGPLEPCPYLDGLTAQMAFLAPDEVVTPHLYSILVAHGFRRSGSLIYRPQCPNCRACEPVRVPVNRFYPSRAQRRSEKHYADVAVVERPATFDAAHYALYRRYQMARHPEGNMGKAGPQEYIDFLANDRFDRTLFLEFIRGDDLLGVAVVDELDQGFSAVYTFFDPDHSAGSLGTFAILWEIRELMRRRKPWLYLGFWIEASPKMRYKSRFKPLERRSESGWITVE